MPWFLPKIRQKYIFSEILCCCKNFLLSSGQKFLACARSYFLLLFLSNFPQIKLLFLLIFFNFFLLFFCFLSLKNKSIFLLFFLCFFSNFLNFFSYFFLKEFKFFLSIFRKTFRKENSHNPRSRAVWKGKKGRLTEE